MQSIQSRSVCVSAFAFRNLKCSVLLALALALFSTVALAQPRDVDEVDPTGATASKQSKRTMVSDKNPVLPPKWAFGVLYASYWDQQKVLDTARRLRQEYCGDLIWVDSSWLSGEYTDKGQNHYINFTFDPTQFPDAKAMIAELRKNHFSFGVWEWPYIDISITNLYQHGEKNHFFITDQKGGEGKVVTGGGWHGVKFTGQLDFSNPKAAAWWKELNQPLIDMGVNFFKIDTYSTVAKGGVTFTGVGSEELRMLYHKTYYEMTETANKGRGFYLAHRTPTPNNDQYPGMWTGDTKASWAGFADDMVRGSKMNTPDTAAYWTCDTGGYNNDYQGDELYIRWLQYGTFLPITEFFSAKQTKGRFPWLFGEDAQRNFRFYTKLRYKLLPFRYSNAQAAYHEKPVKYPVWFPNGSTNEIILGHGDSEIFVAPVYVQGATSREVNLPGGKWINYWTGETVTGGTPRTVDAPLDKVPMFVKVGAIIPMGPEMSYVDEKPADPMTLDIYPSGKSSYTLCEDDGKSNDYKQGKFAKTLMTSEESTGKATVGIGAAQGDFSGKPTRRTYILKINRKIGSPLEITRNGKAVQKSASQAALESANEGWFNDGSIVWVKFSTPASEANQVILSSSDFK